MSFWIRPKRITANGKHDVRQYAEAAVDVAGGTPSGKCTLTTTAETDVSAYATAQVVDSNLRAENIAKDVTVLGITGTHEGGSSDFGTATIILDLTVGSGVGEFDTIIGNVSVRLDGYDFICDEMEPNLNNQFVVPLLMSNGTLTGYIGWVEAVGYDISNVTTTGGITWDDNNETYIVTGDGTISGTVTAPK